MEAEIFSPDARRDTLGVYGPGPGEPSGVAAYSVVLERGLARDFDCVHVSNTDWIPPGEFDYVLYHVGGSARHHCAFEALDARPGPAIIHEPNCLSYYYESWQQLSAAKRAAVLSLFSAAFGKRFGDLPEVLRFLRAHPDFDEWSADVGSELLYLNQVTTAMVHSRFTAEHLKGRWPGPAVTIPQSVPPLSRGDGERMRERLGVGAADLLVGSFGFIGSYKRLDKVLAAWRAWDGKPAGARLLIVGQRLAGPAIPAWRDVIYQGYASDDDFRACLAAADFAVQLRHPTLGETSSVITSQIANGQLVVVSDTPHTAELAGDDVIRVKPDDDEVKNLTEAFGSLAGRVLATAPQRRRRMRYDRRYEARHCANLVATIIRADQRSAGTRPVSSASDRIRYQP